MAGRTRTDYAWRRWLAAALVAALLALVLLSDATDFLTLEELKARQAQLQSWVDAHPWRAGLGYFLAYVLVTALSIPGAVVMTLAGGALFGLLKGTVLVSFASTHRRDAGLPGGALPVARAAARALRRAAAPAFDEGIERDGAFYLFTLRLVPLFPFFMINLLAGLTALRPGPSTGSASSACCRPRSSTCTPARSSRGSTRRPTCCRPGSSAPSRSIGLLPLLMRWLARWLQGRRVYRGHQRPAHFDYNLVVIGAGSAGLVTAYIGAAVKAKVALIEKHRMGGDCLNTGCVPSKALIRSARLLAEARGARATGSPRRGRLRLRRRHGARAGGHPKIEPHDSWSATWGSAST
jgi:uncharacterized membrane protein YdjX (TVP38/TMEM64 family)